MGAARRAFLCYNVAIEPELTDQQKAEEKEKAAARKAAREMKTAIIVMLLSFVLVGVGVLLAVFVGHIKLT
jgi:hypothetical protein